MRIYLTSVEESRKTEQIQKIVKSMFPDYSVAVIPNKYATEKGKAEVKAYQKMYNEKNREMVNRKRRERYARQKAEREKLKMEQESKKIKKQKSKDYER